MKISYAKTLEILDGRLKCTTVAIPWIVCALCGHLLQYGDACYQAVVLPSQRGILCASHIEAPAEALGNAGGPGCRSCVCIEGMEALLSGQRKDAMHYKKETLKRMIEKLQMARACPIHGRSELVICGYCQEDIRCQACVSQVCQCANDD